MFGEQKMPSLLFGDFENDFKGYLGEGKVKNK
jgi:hypothetical protein